MKDCRRPLSHPFHLLVLLAFLAGCAGNAPYHDTRWQRGNCLAADPQKAHTEANACSKSYYQEYPDFDLAFAEFSERGNAFNDRYINDVMERIDARSQATGAVIITFVHGWKHNAEETDTNLVDFRNTLHDLATSSDTRLAGRRLIGLYVGWRGLSVDFPLLIQGTFWERKAVAEEVGKGGMTHLLLELDQRKQQRDDNVLIVVGHSFGGTIVVSALSELLSGQIIDRAHANGRVKPLGDATIVLNPAIEANQALSLVEAASAARYTIGQRPLFVSVSSDADKATHYAFPAGQTLGLMLNWRQTDLARDYYFDRKTGTPIPALKEEHLDTTTIGNFAPFLTHRLVAQSTDTPPLFRLTPCDEDPAGCRPRGLTRLKGWPTIRPLPERYPMYFLKTDKSVMKGHNDIFNEKIKYFMLALIQDTVRQVTPDMKFSAPDMITTEDGFVLDNERLLNRRIETLYESRSRK